MICQKCVSAFVWYAISRLNLSARSFTLELGTSCSMPAPWTAIVHSGRDCLGSIGHHVFRKGGADVSEALHVHLLRDALPVRHTRSSRSCMEHCKEIIN